MAPTKFTRWLLLFTLIGGALRLLWLSHHGIWIDELFSVRDAARIYQDPLAGTMKIVRIMGYLPITLGMYINGVDVSQIDAYSPSLWAAQGITPWTLRIIPAVIGTLTIPLLSYPSRRILGSRAALVLAFLLAISPWHIYWSQLGRFYITQFLFYSLTLILYYTATREGSRPYLLAAMVCFVLAFASQLTSAVLFPIIIGDWLLAKLRGDKLKLEKADYFLIAAAAFIICAMFLVIIMGSERSWMKNIREGKYSPLIFVFKTLYYVGPMVIAMALASLIWKGKTDRRLINYLLIAAIIPITAFALVSFKGHYRPRYAFICYYPWLSLSSIGLCNVYDKISSRFGRIAALLPLVLVTASLAAANINYYFYSYGLRPRWNEAADYIRKHYTKGDKVLFNTPWLGEYFLSDTDLEVISSPEDIGEVTPPLWIATRQKKTDFHLNTQRFSQEQLRTTFVSNNTLGEEYELKVYYLPQKP